MNHMVDIYAPANTVFQQLYAMLEKVPDDDISVAVSFEDIDGSTKTLLIGIFDPEDTEPYDV